LKGEKIMRATFVHTADNHLGYEQYGIKERFNDFARAFLSVIDAAIARQADCFLIAGDLFNKRAIDAMTLMQAKSGLERLKAAGIPAIAIEGNHDRTYYRDGVSWLQFLGWERLLILLNPEIHDGVLSLAPWDSDSLVGAYTDLLGGRMRVYGLPWYGAGTVRVVEAFARELAAARASEDLAGVEYRVLLMHTGIDGIVPQLHGLPTYEQFQPLSGLVDYLGLGHVHKHYSRDNWLYNPGSTETWGAEESAWDRGYFVVDVNSGAPDGELRHTVQHIVNPRRPFLRFTFHVDGLDTPSALHDRFAGHCRQWARDYADTPMSGDGAEPVIDIALSGILGFDTGALERDRLEACVREHFNPLTVRIHDGTRETEYDLETDEEGDGRDRSTWQQLEVHIFQELLARDGRYQKNAPEWARLLAELKQMALGAEEPAQIALRLRETRAKLLS
jgi:DNA repair exonuclease SbcCD nuclease subunit